MAEIAVVSSEKARLRRLADQGNAKARIALALAGATNRFLSTVQIGITRVGIFAGAFGGATLATELAGKRVEEKSKPFVEEGAEVYVNAPDPRQRCAGGSA